MKQVTGNAALVASNDITDVVDYKWRKLSEETGIGYQYFKQYLALPVPRKLDRLANQLRMSRSGLSVYCAKFKWLERAAAYDDNENTKELEKKRRHREKQDLEWSARRDEQREAEWQIAQELLDKVRQMLRVPLFRETVEETLEGLDPQGRIIIRQIIINEPLDWSAVDIARFFDVAAKMARLATGMATDRKSIKINVSAMSDDELQALADED